MDKTGFSIIVPAEVIVILYLSYLSGAIDVFGADNLPDRTITVENGNQTTTIVNVQVQTSDIWTILNVIITPISVLIAAFVGAFWAYKYNAKGEREKEERLKDEVKRSVRLELGIYLDFLTRIKRYGQPHNKEWLLFHQKMGLFQEIERMAPFQPRYYPELDAKTKAQVFNDELGKVDDAYRALITFCNSQNNFISTRGAALFRISSTDSLVALLDEVIGMLEL